MVFTRVFSLGVRVDSQERDPATLLPGLLANHSKASSLVCGGIHSGHSSLALMAAGVVIFVLSYFHCGL